MLVIVWRALGFPLSFSKGKRGTNIVWISGALRVSSEAVDVSIKPAIVEDVRNLCGHFKAQNVIPVKQVRALAGKSSVMASVVFMLRPFLSDLWGALAGAGFQTSAPMHCIWSRQIAPAVSWIAAFVDGTRGSLTRSYALKCYLASSSEVEVCVDASPWGLGAYLAKHGAIVEYFHSSVSIEEASVLGQQIGKCESQQTFEALAVLVALRTWAAHWIGTRSRLRIRSDSVSALVMLLKLKVSGKGPNLIAREIALDMAEAIYQPEVLEHVPGITNKICDQLSRLSQPGKEAEFPEQLRGVTCIQITQRQRGYFRAALAP